MPELNAAQIRNFRLQAHHLHAACSKADIPALVGACGMQNTPPGAWETALYNRAPACSLLEMEQLLACDRSLLQAWSFRGAPFVFPANESAVFLSPLAAQEGEPWVYTPGILLALDFLQLPFDELFERLKQVMPQLDEHTIVSKSTLDQTLAEWMLPLLPAQKRSLWNSPSMYGSPDKQTVGGAVVSFLLRPCAFSGLVVFGAREGISPTFTSYKNWLGRPLATDGEAPQKLVRKFLHCYGPATLDSFVSWLGCSRAQGQRLWRSAAEEMEPVTVLGKKGYILSADKERLLSPVPLQRELLLLGGHDPYLDQRDRSILLPSPPLQRRVWQTISNPGAVVRQGAIIGTWTSKKKARGINIQMTLWAEPPAKQALCDLAEGYAAFGSKRS